jgi:uncharacterized protein involved in exopolysaccharide biosynthesis
MTENEKYPDEIDIYELLLVLKKRIKYIVGVFVAGVIIATMVSFLMPNIYQARATLWVDSLLMQSILENLQLSKFKNEGKFSFIIPLQQGKSPDINNFSLAILSSLEFKKKVINRLKETYSNNEDLNNLEKAINSGIGEGVFKADIDKKTGSIILTSEQRSRKFAEDILKIAIDEFGKKLEKALEAYSAVTVSGDRSTNKSKSFVLNVIENPNSLENPVKPKKKLIIAVSAISSLFLGIFLAFVVEWWSKVKRG